MQALGIKNPLDRGSDGSSQQLIQSTTFWRLRRSARFDLIVTGVISFGDADLETTLLEEVYLGHIVQYVDWWFDQSKDSVCRGSGCACSAVVTYWPFIYTRCKKEFTRIFVRCELRALLSPIMDATEGNDPTIAHAMSYLRELKESWIVDFIYCISCMVELFSLIGQLLLDSLKLHQPHLNGNFCSHRAI